MEFKVNKEMLKGIGNVGLKLGKTIVIEGCKAVVLNAAATTIKTSFESGFAGVKDLTFDELLDGKDKKVNVVKSGGIFGRKKKQDEEELVVEILNADGSKVTK